MHVNTDKQNIYQDYNDDMPANLILEFALLSIIYNWSLTKNITSLHFFTELAHCCDTMLIVVIFTFNYVIELKVPTLNFSKISKESKIRKYLP